MRWWVLHDCDIRQVSPDGLASGSARVPLTGGEASPVEREQAMDVMVVLDGAADSDATELDEATR